MRTVQLSFPNSFPRASCGTDLRFDDEWTKTKVFVQVNQLQKPAPAFVRIFQIIRIIRIIPIARIAVLTGAAAGVCFGGGAPPR